MADLKQGNVFIDSGGGTLDHFKDLGADAPLRVGIYGKPKSYKTSLALSFPEPVFLINMDREASPLKRWFRNKDISVHDILVPPDQDLDPELVGDILHEFMDSYRGALDQPEGTVIVDTVSVLWTLIQVFVLKGVMAKREARAARKGGKPAELYQYDWADANMLYENILLAPKGSKMHVVFIARSSQEYNSQGRQTGDFKPQAQKSTPFLVNLWLRMERRPIETVEFKVVRGKRRRIVNEEDGYVAIVEGSGFGTDQEGRELENPTFEDLAALASEEAEA